MDVVAAVVVWDKSKTEEFIETLKQTCSRTILGLPKIFGHGGSKCGKEWNGNFKNMLVKKALRRNFRAQLSASFGFVQLPCAFKKSPSRAFNIFRAAPLHYDRECQLGDVEYQLKVSPVALFHTDLLGASQRND